MFRHYRTFIFLCIACGSLAQSEDTLNYRLFRDRLVVYSDLGFKAAPFELKYDYPNGIKTLRFKHNLKPIAGIGIAFKWFALRIGFSLPGHLRPVDKFGRSNYTDFGIKFNTGSRIFWDLDFRVYGGYIIKDAYKWNDTLSKDFPHLKRSGTQTASGSINCWFFRSRNFNMKSVFGISGDFRRSTGTWYYKSTLNFFGVGNGTGTIIPTALTDTSVTKTLASSASALDIGFVPGYAYVYRNGNWQASIFGGLGAVIQSKFFRTTGADRGFLGLAPRVDFRFISGYSKDNYFVNLLTDFDIKSISFQNMRYSQTFYAITLCGGYRFKLKEKEKNQAD